MKNRRTYKIRISQFSEYKNLIKECQDCLKILFPNNSIGIVYRKERCVDIYVYSNALPTVFPQHGPNRKDQRKLILEEWQRNVIKQFPQKFIKGLIDSDGSKYMWGPKGYKGKYLGFVFSNKSEDIKDFFCWTCDLIGVKYKRKLDYKNVSITKKEDVLILNEFIPFKS